LAKSATSNPKFKFAKSLKCVNSQQTSRKITCMKFADALWKCSPQWWSNCKQLKSKFQKWRKLNNRNERANCSWEKRKRSILEPLVVDLGRLNKYIIQRELISKIKENGKMLIGLSIIRWQSWFHLGEIMNYSLPSTWAVSKVERTIIETWKVYQVTQHKIQWWQLRTLKVWID